MKICLTNFTEWCDQRHMNIRRTVQEAKTFPPPISLRQRFGLMRHYDVCSSKSLFPSIYIDWNTALVWAWHFRRNTNRLESFQRIPTKLITDMEKKRIFFYEELIMELLGIFSLNKRILQNHDSCLQGSEGMSCKSWARLIHCGSENQTRNCGLK